LSLEIWFLTIPKKKSKHKFFILDCVPIDPSNVTSTNIEPDVVVIDLNQVEIDLANSKKRKKNE
jgi:hypothetical protein